MVHQDGASFKAPSSTAGRPQPPAALRELPRWCCWRARKKKYRYRGEPREHVVHEALHPDTGHELAVSRPGTWVSFDQVCQPRARKPFGGVGFLVRREDGLGVVRNAPLDLPARLGHNALHAEREVDGDGLAVIVRLEVHGATTDRLVPLSGRTPCQEGPAGGAGASPDNSPDELRTTSGQEACQQDGLSGRTPCQESGPCPDDARTVFSSSPLLLFKTNATSGREDTLRAQLLALAERVVRRGWQEKKKWKEWVYSLIGLFRMRGLKLTDVTPNSLLAFAETIQVGVADVQTLVAARWGRWKAHKVPLGVALQAVRADPTLLDEVRTRIAVGPTFLAAGMAKFLGRNGEPFVLPGRVLAQVLGLLDQRSGSDVVLALVELGLIRRVAEARYADKKAAEYVWVAAQAPTPPAPQADPPACRAVAPPASPPSPAGRSEGQAVRPQAGRPGWSPVETREHPYEVGAGGGYLSATWHFTEMVVRRQLGEKGRTLPAKYWLDEAYFEVCKSQARAAKHLLERFGQRVLGEVLRTDRKLFSLRPSWVAERCEAVAKEHAVCRALWEEEAKNRPPEPPPPTAPVTTRTPFVRGRSTLDKLRDIGRWQESQGDSQAVASN